MVGPRGWIFDGWTAGIPDGLNARSDLRWLDYCFIYKLIIV